MKLCRTCNTVTTDENNYCPHDGDMLVKNPIATMLQDSLGTKYTITKLVGVGSMGAVYRAQHEALDDVAIKVMLGPPDNHRLSQRFLREARALRKLRHPNSVLIYDLERSPDGLTYMVMEMVEGRSLRAVLEERGQISLEETMEIAEAVCSALQAAHERGIIHRDLKPDNILLAEEKGTGGSLLRTVKIADFGIVKLRGTREGGEEASMQLTKHGTPIGTPFYMSPEQWFGDGPGITALDGRTDIYSLGCTIYEMLAGEPPFIGETTEEMRRKHLNDPPRPLNELVPRISANLSRVILRSLEKDRDLRPASPKEFAAELRRAYEESAQSVVEEKQEEAAPTPQEPTTTAKNSGGKKPVSEMQETEEAVPLVRDWAAEDARQAIEQMIGQQQQPPVPMPVPPVASQPATEHVTQRAPESVPATVKKVEEAPAPARPRVEPEASRQKAAPSAASEFQQTQIMKRPTTRTPKPASEAKQEVKAEARDLVLARAGGRRIGVLADEAASVEAWRAPVPLPHAPKAVLGIVSVRGRMLTVLDLRALLDGQQAGAGDAPHTSIIILRGDEQLALAVESVDGTIKVNSDKIAPTDQDSNTSAVRALLTDERGEIAVLNTRELFDAAINGTERRRQRT
jgi:serine/threonine-protein kinase